MREIGAGLTDRGGVHEGEELVDVRGEEGIEELSEGEKRREGTRERNKNEVHRWDIHDIDGMYA